MRKLLPFLILLFPLTASATILGGGQGGTGFATTTAGNIGNCLQVSNNSPLVYTFATCSGGGSTGVATTSLLANAPIFLSKTNSAITFSWFGLTTTTQPSSSNLLTSNGSNGVYGTATSSGTVSSPLTGNFICVGSGCTLGIQAASASQAGSMSAGDWSLLHTATTTFSAPLTYTLSTNAVTLPAAGASQNGYLASTDWQLLHTATTTFTSPLVYTLSTNAVTCPTCNTTNASVSSIAAGTGIGGGTITTTGTHYLLSYLATSSAETRGQLAYWTSQGGTPGQLGSVSTSSVSAGTGVSLSASPGALVGGSALTITNTGVISGSCSGGTSCSGTNPLSISSFGFPFTFNTLNTFSTSTLSTSTSLWTSGVFFASSTAQASQFPYATSTAFTSSFYFGAGLTNCTGSNFQQWSNGTWSCNAAPAAGSSNPGFTFSTIFGVANTAATTSQIQVTGGLAASSTVRFGNAGVAFQWLWDAVNGRQGIGSTTPTMALSIGSTGSNYGSIVDTENPVATSTGITIDWKQGNSQLIQLGTVATKIGFNNASTSGEHLLLTICNPGSTAGAITWIAPIEWSAGGTLPTQTTTANVCDDYYFHLTQATSTKSGTPKVFGSQNPNYP